MPETIDKSRLLTYLSDLASLYSPSAVDINGRWIGGDEKLYFFVKGLEEEIKR